MSAIGQSTEMNEMLKLIYGKDDAERNEAENLSRCLYARKVAELDLNRAKSLLCDLQLNRTEREQRNNPVPNTCWQCGCYSPRGECIACKGGKSLQFARARI